jgi:predicted nucleic acid-binding Zn ribbon protein
MERAGRLISKLKLPAGSVSLDELARAGWPAAVGKRIAARARAVSLAGNRLIVEVEDSIWQRQLSVLKKQILRKLEEVLGRSVVVDVDFRVLPRRRLPQLAEPDRQPKDESDQIQDPVLRTIYREQRRRRPA